MWPTLRDGDILEAIPYDGQVLNIEDLLIFYDPRDSSRVCIKRLKRIEADGYFVEGDNPDPMASTDSHTYALVPDALVLSLIHI